VSPRQAAGPAARILVTGTDGYLGCIIASTLLERGCEVTGVDAGFYRSGWLYDGVEHLPRTISRDIRDLEVDDLKGHQAVVHLAELSNDPLGELAPRATKDINHRGSARLARLAKSAGVSRFVYMSSCSVYGLGGSGFVSEASPVHPQTLYAACKILVEREVLALAGPSFHPTVLRNATAYGASPRMRFDIVLNNLLGLAWTTGEIRMSSDGTPWRPLVHVRDTASAVVAVLESPPDAVHGEILNVGSNDQNYRIRDVARIVGSVVTGCTTTFGPPSADNRSYRVNFDHIKAVLPGFRCAWDARAGARELADVFSLVNLDADLFAHLAFTRIDQLRFLRRSGQLDHALRWTTMRDLPGRAGSAVDVGA
jgi:nucleoside-diphosphate-sugar epimerase